MTKQYKKQSNSKRTNVKEIKNVKSNNYAQQLNDQSFSIVDEGLDVLEEADFIKKDCGDFLRDMTDKEVTRSSEFKKEIEEIVDSLFWGKISLLDCNKAIDKSAEQHTRVLKKTPKEIANFLLARGVLTQRHDGHIPSYPFWPYMYKIMDYEMTHRINGAPLISVNRAVRWLVGRMRTHDILRDRAAVARALASHVGQEPAVMFSNTPAIFNPYEFEYDDKLNALDEEAIFKLKNKLNYTKNFTETLKMASSPVVYVWNKDAILKQIEDQLRIKNIAIEELHDKYSENFSQYAGQTNIEIYWGDNSVMTDPSRSLQYISDRHLVIGGREEEKMSYGVLIDRRLLRNVALVAIGTAAGIGANAVGIPPFAATTFGATISLLSAGTLDALLGTDSFFGMQEVLVHNVGYAKLSGDPAIGVVNKVFDEFTQEKRRRFQ